MTVARVVLSGLRMGFWAATVRGIGAGVLLAPRALRFRWSDPRTRLSTAAKAKLRSMSETAGMTFGRRVAHRLRLTTLR